MSADKDRPTICLPDRNAKIAEFAYYKAENRGFAPGTNLKTGLRQKGNFYCADAA